MSSNNLYFFITEKWLKANSVCMINNATTCPPWSPGQGWRPRTGGPAPSAARTGQPRGSGWSPWPVN